MEPKAHPYILFVDDDKLFSDIVTRRFDAESMHMVHTASAEEALQILRQDEKPDLLILDLHLSGMGGFELLEKIRAEPGTAKLPVVVLSNFNDPKDIERSHSFGVLRHIQKVTLTPKEVVEMTRDVLNEQSRS